MENISKLTPILYEKNETSFNHNGLGKLTKLLVNEIDEVLNGEFEALFEYPANGRLADKIDNEMFIKAKPNKKDDPHVFKIYDYELDTFTQTYLIYARSKNIEDLKNNVILDVNVKNLAPTQAWNLAKNNALDPVVTTFYSDITTTSSVHWERRSLLSTIAGQEGSMIQYWGGEIKHGINRISLFRRRGQDNVTTVRHGKNLDGLKATYSTKGLVTAIVPYYVKSDDKAVYGDVVESQYIKKYPSTYYDIIEYNDEELGLSREDEPENGYSDSTIKTALNKVAKRYFDKNVGKDLPSINIEIALEDISQTKEYEQFKDFEQIEIGDTITVYSKKFNVNINAKVRRVVYNGLTDKNELVEVGTARRSLYDDVRDDFKKVETELQEGIDHAMASANGKNTNYYGTADPNEIGLVGQNNDNYFRTNGQFKELWIYRDGMWHLEVGDLTGQQIRAEVEQAQVDIEAAQATADEAVEQIDTAVANAGFTSLDETISSVQSISNQAQINAGTAIDNALEAMQQASQAVDNTGSLNIRVDDVENTLSVKADKQTVDDLTGVVDLQALDIKANADGLKLKANQDTVDLIDGRVSSLGTEVSAVAGQISNKVWKTDIETAIDGIEIGGRNLLLDSKPLIVNDRDYLIRRFKISSNKLNTGENITISINGEIPEEKEGFRFYNSSGSGAAYIGYVEKSDFDGGNYASKTFRWREHGDNNELWVYAYPNLDNTGADIEWIKLERGTKVTDWSPAPEDTDAKIDHIETEWTQTFERFDQTVSDIDGRVTAQTQEIDRITSTIQEVTEDVEGNTTKINQTVSTVDKHTQTIANIETDLDGKVETSEYNTLVSTVDSTIRRIGDVEGNITQVEQSVNGLQSTVSKKVSHDELDSGLNDLWEDYRDDLPIQLGGVYNHIGTVQTQWTQTFDSFSQTVTAEIATKVDDEEYAESITLLESKITQNADNINLRVSKDEIITQINLSPESILLQANKIQALGDVVVDGKLTITDEFIAPNAQIDGAKIADATIGSAKIANIDASKISTGELRGVHVYAKTGEIGDWSLEYGVLYSQIRSGENTSIKATGAVAFAAGAPNPRNTENANLQIYHDGKLNHLKSGIVRKSLKDEYIRFYAQNGDRRGTIESGGNFQITAHDGELHLYAVNSEIYARSALRPYVNGGINLGGVNYRWTRTYVTQSESVSSDARFKSDIQALPKDLIKYIAKYVKPKQYTMYGKTHYGYVAQDVRQALREYARTKVAEKEVNDYVKRFDFLQEDESLALTYAEIAVIKDEEQNLRIKELENRIEELENAS